jgi:hypothetical protein
VLTRLQLTVLCAVLVLGCGAPARQRHASACADGFRWRARDYLGVNARSLPSSRGEIHIRVPGCHDSAADANDPNTDIEVEQLTGVPASVALGARDPQTLYVANDSLPALNDHPLHRYLSEPPARRRPRRCRAEMVSGQMGAVPLGDRFVVHDGVRTERLRLEPGTRLDSRAVDGVPRIHQGDRVTVSALACPGRTVKIALELRVR